MDVIEFERVGNLKFFIIPARLGRCGEELFTKTCELEFPSRCDGIPSQFSYRHVLYKLKPRIV